MSHPILTRSVLCIGLLATMAGCFGSAPPKERYHYYLTLPAATTVQSQGPRLALGDITSAPGYDSERMAFRVEHNELRYYGFREWVTTPPKLIEEAVLRHLEVSKRFSQIDLDERMKDPQAVLTIHIDALEEIDEKERTKARLALSFTLRGVDTDRVLLRHSFDEQRVCAERHPGVVARAISAILGQQMNLLVQRLVKRLAYLSK